jgi:UDP-N-acetylmuramoyl-tripeptide--D-alanyl-D-alanine ligase
MDDAVGGFGAAWFASAAGGTLVNGGDVVLSRVETDSRNVGPGALFVALKGERVDGHDFVQAAAKAGASALLVSSSWWTGSGSSSGLSCPLVVVSDPLTALQQAAKAWRQGFPKLLRFGVTGSSGKTSVKEMLAAIIGVKRNTVRNPGNLNSDIGLPSSLLLIRPEHEAAVFEMGINRPGEMDLLADLYEPDCAVVTNIGTAHIGVLGGTRQSIADEKRRITAKFTGSQRLVVPEDDDFRDFLLTGLNGAGFLHGLRSVEGFSGARDLGLDGWQLSYGGTGIKLALPGAHNLRNALAAIRAASLYGAKADDVRRGLESIRPLSGRTEIIKGQFTLVNDCYNANIESSLAALAFCDELRVPGRKLYVFGSMKELGDETLKAHERLGRATARSSATLVYFYGEETRHSYDTAMKAGANAAIFHFDEFEALSAAVSAAVKPGDLVLLKASHSMALERLAERLSSSQDAVTGGHHVS